MTQPPDNPRPEWTPPAWTPPPARGGQPPQQPYQPPQQPYRPAQQPQQPWQPPTAQQPPPWQQPGHGAPRQPDSWELAPGNPPPSSGAHRSRTIALVVAAVVVVAGVAGGVFLLRGDDTKTGSGGAASPQEAVTKMAGAVADQDVDAMLSYIDPAESRTIAALISAGRDKFGATGVVAATGVPAPYLSLALDGVQVQTDKVRTDLAFVTLTGGTATITADPNKVPAAVSGGQTRPRTQRANLARAFAGTRIGVVQSGGRWYLSPTTTLLEAIRTQSRLPEPDFTVAPTTTGGDSPEDAITGLVNAINQKDVRGAAGYLSAKEIPALPYYYDVFASQLRGRQGQLGATISGVDLSTEDMTNGLKKVTVKGATVANGGRKLTYSAGCVTSDGERRCVDSKTRTLFALSEPFFVVEQNGGKWQISPIATITEYLRTIVSDGNIDALYRRVNAEALAPVTATVKIGDSASVPLNDAGFAHVVITGSAGACFDATLADESQSISFGELAFSDKCRGHYAIPSTGKLDAAVDQESFAKGTAKLTITGA